jgi:hypothetical protein
MSVNQLQETEKEAIRVAREKGGATKALTYLKFSGPGWLQGAITLGGGSLTGALYLGVLAGYQLLWVQLVAMVMGVIMLSAIAYVTLSTGKRPFQAINEHINPVLGWSWAIATLMANVVWCLPQFSLGVAAVRQNLLPGMLGAESGMDETTSKIIVAVVLLGVATAIIWFYDSGGRGIKLFESLLKTMVAVVVISFFGVVAVMTFQGALNWGEVFSGFVPNLGYFNHPSPAFDTALAATGAFESFWSDRIVAPAARQRLAGVGRGEGGHRGLTVTGERSGGRSDGEGHPSDTQETAVRRASTRDRTRDQTSDQTASRRPHKRNAAAPAIISSTP